MAADLPAAQSGDVAADGKAMPEEEMGRPSLLDGAGQYRALKQWFEDDKRHSDAWRKEAKEDFDFVAGRQFTTDEEQMLRDSKRVPVVFNRALTMIKSVAGMEINGRHEIAFLPRNTEDTAVNEVLTGASKWMGQECDGEDEESEAFEHTAVCGMGWCLSGDTMVRLPDRTHFATSRKYSGTLVEINLENGKKLTGTPNHPILTDMGWKRLSAVNEGDNLVTSKILERIKLPVHHFDEVETRFEDKVNAFGAGREVGTFATTPNDFYADGAGSKVHVVYADRFLLDKLRNVARVKHRKQGLLAWGHILAKRRAALFSQRVLNLAFCTSVSQPALYAGHVPSSYFAGGHFVSQFAASSRDNASHFFVANAKDASNLHAGLFFRKIKPHDLVDKVLAWGSSFFARPKLVAGANKTQSNRARVNSNLIADFSDCKPVLEIEARKLVGTDAHSVITTKVSRKTVSVVYDFAVHDVGTSIGFYLAADIITSNCEHILSFDEEPEGKYEESWIDPLEMYWDCRSRKKNLADARRITRVRTMPIGEAMALFPGHQPAELDANWASGKGEGAPEKTLEERRIRTENVTDFADRNEVTVVQTQWYEKETYWLVADPVTNTKAQVPDKDFKKLQARAAMIGMQLMAVRMKKKVYKQAFLGAKLLESSDGPLPDRFGFTCVTGQSDHNKGVWFGLVRVMRDPAKWANKFFVQAMHIMNSNAKGGLMAETDAFEDQAQAEATYARPDAITWLKKGAISGQGQKVMPKPDAKMPQVTFELMGIAVDAMKDVTGINLELLGQQDQNQPGVLEYQRKQAGMTVLATMFDSLRRARKQVGRIRLYFIQNFLSDGRLIRITGPAGAKVIPLLKDKTLGEYDVVVGDAPTSPNQKEMTWTMIQPLLAQFKDQLVQRPDIFAMLLEYSPLPDRIVEALKVALTTPQPDQIAQQELAKQAAVAKINKDQSTAEMQNAKAGATQATAMYDLAMAGHLMAKENQANPVGEQLDNMKKAAEIQTEHAKAGQIGAQTAQAYAGANKAHHDARKSAIESLIAAFQPIPHEPPMQGAASLQ